MVNNGVMNVGLQLGLNVLQFMWGVSPFGWPPVEGQERQS
jgi:hypothetical protein